MNRLQEFHQIHSVYAAGDYNNHSEMHSCMEAVAHWSTVEHHLLHSSLQSENEKTDHYKHAEFVQYHIYISYGRLRYGKCI